jgi:hypothetical protein
MGYGPELTESYIEFFLICVGVMEEKKNSHQLAKSKNIIDLDKFTDR